MEDKNIINKLSKIRIYNFGVCLEQNTYKFYKAGVFNKPYLTQKEGRYKGQPFRSFSWGKFTNGYSDHYPSFVYLIKETN